MTQDLVARTGAIGIGMTKTDAAYYEIHRRILLGIIVPGSKVDQESLAAQLGLSTTPVREALRRLEAANLITLAAHREAWVAPLTNEELTELYDVRLSLDPLAATSACDHVTPEAIARLRALLVQPPPADIEQRLLLNRQLHTRIYSMSDNNTLIKILDQLWDRSDRYRLVLLRRSPTAMTTSHQEHQDIVQALEARDKRKVGRLMREHLIGSLSMLRPLLED